ncbi:tripartite tricarboxylate transporter substrate binding protein [Falsiroseomonas sp.]|uniref:tripartite tricarboxylate transporter substrate binding protein n=1 Tax=Falsiroseomonas sp. TaxID=2870721 RepID=UPI003F71F68D
MSKIARRPLLGLLALAPAAAVAQEARWPNRPIRLIVAFAPGGFTDIAGRLIAQALSQELGQPVVVDNRAGAAGLIGTETAAQAAPDGNTLLLGTISTHAMNVGLYATLPYDPLRSFVAVAGVASGQLVLAVHPSVAAESVPALIAMAKAQPGKLTYGSGGNGTTSHLAGELFKSMAGIDLLHVPFRSPAPAASALLAGQVDLMFDTLPTSLPNIRAGKLRVLGVTSPTRVAELPGVPAVAETLPGFDTGTWVGLFAPAGTPPAIVSRVEAATRKTLAAPDMQSRLSDLGMQPMTVGGDDFAAYVRSEIEKWVGVVRRANIRAD